MVMLTVYSDHRSMRYPWVWFLREWPNAEQKVELILTIPTLRPAERGKHDPHQAAGERAQRGVDGGSEVVVAPLTLAEPEAHSAAGGSPTESRTDDEKSVHQPRVSPWR